MADTHSLSSETGEPMSIDDTLYAQRLFGAPVDQLAVKPEARDEDEPSQVSDDEADPWIEGP